MRGLFLVSGLFLLIGCVAEREERSFRVRDYYPIDSVLVAQKAILMGLPLQKTVVIGDKRESVSLTIDAAFLEKEWEALEAFNINKPGFVGAIDVIKSDSSILYKPKAGQNIKLDFVQYTFSHQGALSRISGAFLDDNAKTIYGSFRNFQLDFEEGVIDQYQISGFQKIILKDTVFFEVRGQVQ